MSIIDLDVEYQTIKNELAQAQQDFLDINSLTKEFIKIIGWYADGKQPDKLIVIDEVEQNREDYDLWAGRATTFSDYMGLLGYTTLGFLESIFRSQHEFGIFSESRGKLDEQRKSLQLIISTKTNEMRDKKEDLINAMTEYHTIEL